MTAVRDIPLLVIVDGPPARGKTIANSLGARLGLPMFSKDVIKDALFDVLETGDRAWSRKMGTASVEVILRLAQRELPVRPRSHPRKHVRSEIRDREASSDHFRCSGDRGPGVLLGGRRCPRPTVSRPRGDRSATPRTRGSIRRRRPPSCACFQSMAATGFGRGDDPAGYHVVRECPSRLDGV